MPQKKVGEKEVKFSQKIKDMCETRRKNIRSEWQLYAFLAVIIFGIPIILFITRAYYFRGMMMLDGMKPNVFYMISRACGKHKFIK